MKVAWLTGMPRSGTTWVSQFFAASPDVRVKFCPLFSYTFKNCMTLDDDAVAWQEFFNRVYLTNDEFMDQLHLKRYGLVPDFHDKHLVPEWLFIKSNRHHHLTEHLMRLLPDLRMIALVRNPMAMMNSWLNNSTEFPVGADPLKEWRSGSCRKTGTGEYWGFDDWKWVTDMHLRLRERYPDRFFLYRYEDCVRDPHTQARSMFSNLDIEYTEHVDEFIRNSQSSHNDNTRSVYKTGQNTDKWKDRLDPRIIDGINTDLTGTPLVQFLDD